MNYNESMFKNILILIGIAMALFISSHYWLFDSNLVEITKKTSDTTKEVYVKNIKLTVDIADETHEQTQGLSGLEYMAEDKGMLFIFQQSFIPAFWMKDMKFGLDIIWIDADKTIIGIEKNVLPETFPKTFSPPSPVKYVLEVNSNWSDNNQIKAGNKVSF